MRQPTSQTEKALFFQLYGRQVRKPTTPMEWDIFAGDYNAALSAKASVAGENGSTIDVRLASIPAAQGVREHYRPGDVSRRRWLQPRALFPNRAVSDCRERQHSAAHA